METSVLNISVLREVSDSLQRERILLLRNTPVQESIRHWLHLQSAFEWQLQQTAMLFAHKRWTVLIELQARLQLLAD